MVVLKLIETTNKDTVAVLRCLLDKAIKGEVTAVALCYRTADLKEHAAFSGIYKVRPGAGVNAAMRISWALTQAQESLNAPRR
jgi:hypothetical protein